MREAADETPAQGCRGRGGLTSMRCSRRWTSRHRGTAQPTGRSACWPRCGTPASSWWRSSTASRAEAAW